MKRCLVTILLFGLYVGLQGQKSTDLVFELQAYPTGIIPGFKLERQLSDRSTFLLRIGYNAFDHRDLGVHDSETGGGFGFSA